MSPRSPGLPNPGSWPARLAVAAWPAGQSTPHRARAGLVVVAGASALALLAAWIVPPLLDWGRFRTGIAAIAAAQLGRKVTLGGEVTLRLLPEAVLTASDVTLPDQGDGVSAQIGALRLQVAVLPLLTGRIVPRDLVLGTPVLRLPWPLPEMLAHPARPRVPRAFAAHMENGTVSIGPAQVTGINASIHGGPEPASGIAATGLVSAEPGTLGIGADGFATFGGRSWRFTTALGVPDADGISAVDLAVSGQGVAGQTRGTIQGTLADGVLQGRLLAGGPDLSQLAPAAPLAWHVEAPFVADGVRIEARAIGVSLGGAPADASLMLRLKEPARLDGRVHAASLDLDGWMRVLRSWRPGRGRRGTELPALPGRVEWTADVARFLGGTLRGLHGTLTSDGSALALEQVETDLPGAAHLKMTGRISAGPDGPRLTGPAQLDAPALRETLAWLRALAPSLADAVPPSVLRQASVSGMATIGADTLAAAGLAGQIDGAPINGDVAITLGDHTHVKLAVALERLPLDDWLGGDRTDSGQGERTTLAGIGQRATRLDSELHIKAATASWRGLAFQDAALDLRTGQVGLVVDHAALRLSGTRLAASGTVAPDGSVSGGALSASADDLAVLPPSWRRLPGLWQGEGSLQASVAGAPGALDFALRVEAGDLLLEAEGRGDTVGRTASGTVTLRHPGAPRLLASLGIVGAAKWLDTGSVAMRAHVSARPGLVSADDFDLNATGLRLSGALALDVAGDKPFLHGRVAAEDLALPTTPEVPTFPDITKDLSWMRDWAAELSLSATRLTIGGRDVAHQIAAQIGLGGGNGLVQASANIAGGHLAGQVAVDAGAGTPREAVQGTASGLHLDALPTTLTIGLPLGVEAGEADADFVGDAEGGTLAALRRSLDGTAQLTLRGAVLTGLDVAKAGQVFTQAATPSRRALQAALSGGATRDLSGTIGLTVTQGRLRLAPAALVSPAGSLSVGGTADLAGGIVDLTVGMTPAGVTAPGLGLVIAGPWDSAYAAPTFGPTVSKRHTRKPGPRRLAITISPMGRGEH